MIVNPLGVLALADGDVQEFKPFPEDLSERCSRFSKILRGELISEVREVLSKLAADGHKEIMVSPSTILEALAREVEDVKFSELDHAVNLEEIFVERGYAPSVEEYRLEVKKVLDRIVAEELKEAVARRDMMIVHAVHVLEDLEDYMRIVAELGSRKNFDEERLA